jgi:hypothetical protein
MIASIVHGFFDEVSCGCAVDEAVLKSRLIESLSGSSTRG